MEKEVFKGRYFTVTTEETPSGTLYERVHQRHGITVFPIPAEKKIRLVRKNGKPQIIPMAAYIEDGEEPINCAKRELQEELGLIAKTWVHLTTILARGSIEKSQHYFIARDLRVVKFDNPDPNEKIEPVDLTYEEAGALLLSGGLDNAGADNCLALLKFLLQEIQ